MKSSSVMVPMVNCPVMGQFQMMQFQQRADRIVGQYYGAGSQIATTFQGWQINLGH